MVKIKLLLILSFFLFLIKFTIWLHVFHLLWIYLTIFLWWLPITILFLHFILIVIFLTYFSFFLQWFILWNLSFIIKHHEHFLFILNVQKCIRFLKLIIRVIGNQIYFKILTKFIEYYLNFILDFILSFR